MGGVGSGKTFVGILRMLRLLDEYPGSRGAIVRQSLQQLKKTTAATLWKLLPREHVKSVNHNDGIVNLNNGSQLLFVYLDKPDSLNNLKSLELNFAYVDQLEDISADAWDVLVERIGRWSGASRRGGFPKSWQFRDRMGTPIPPRYVFASAYSPGYDHWITARWWEHGVERERFRKDGYKVIVGSTRDNLAISKEYLDSRLAMGNDYVKRFVDALEWGATEGRIFNLSPLSILEPSEELMLKIKRRMKLHRVYDHGEFSPAACLWYATDDKNNVFFYREYMRADSLVSEHRRNIYELSKADGFNGEFPSYSSNLADPAIFKKNRGRTLTSAPTWSVSDEWSDRRLIEAETAVNWRGADNNEEMTISRVKEYLRVVPFHIHPLTGTRGAPHVYFIRKTESNPYGCHEVLADIRNARREEEGTAPDGSKIFKDKRDEKVRDHLLDCVRYALASRPSKAKSATPPVSEDGVINFNEYMKQGGDDFFSSRTFSEPEPPPSMYTYGE